MNRPPLDYLIAGYVYGLFTAGIAYHTGALAKQTWTKWRRRRFSVASPASSKAIAEEAEDMGGMENQLSFEDALEKRDDVLAEGVENNSAWVTKATEILAQRPVGEDGTWEDFRFRLTEAGLGKPRHSNSWGPLCALMVRRGLLIKTGEYRPMQSAGSNGRSTAVYVRSMPKEKAA